VQSRNVEAHGVGAIQYSTILSEKYETKSKLTFSGKFGKLLVLLENP
jgi:hypothetical protein